MFLFQESHLNSAAVSTTPAVVVVVSARVVSLNIYPLVTFNTDHRPLGAGRAWSGIKGILETNAENEGGEILQKSKDHNNATI